MADGRQVGRHDLPLREPITGKPVNLRELAVSGLESGAEATSEDETDQLNFPTIWIAVDLSRWIAQGGKDPLKLDLMPEFLTAFSASALGKGFSWFQPAAGQAPGSVVEPPTKEEPAPVVKDCDAGTWYQGR